MTKRASELTPEQLTRLRETQWRYREKTRERRRARDREYVARRRATDPDFRRRRDIAANRARIKAKYGVTPEEVRTALKAQNHRCAICERKLKNYHIDHCHTKNKFRAILCPGCNTFLGRVEKYPRRLWRTLQYIEDHK